MCGALRTSRSTPCPTKAWHRAVATDRKRLKHPRVLWRRGGSADAAALRKPREIATCHALLFGAGVKIQAHRHRSERGFIVANIGLHWMSRRNFQSGAESANYCRAISWAQSMNLQQGRAGVCIQIIDDLPRQRITGSLT